MQAIPSRNYCEISPPEFTTYQSDSDMVNVETYHVLREVLTLTERVLFPHALHK